MASGHHHQRDKHANTNQEPITISAASSASAPASSTSLPTVISRETLRNLKKEVDPNVQIDEETEDVLLGYSDEFLEDIIEGACKLAVHRKASSLEVGDIELFLERHCNMWISSDPNKEEPAKPPKKLGTAEAHRQRMALIKKTLKKY